MGYSKDRNGEVIAGPFPDGMNNRLRDHDLPDGAARNIVNADVDNQGKVTRRKGLTKIYSGKKPSSGYSCPLGTFFIENQSLRKLKSDGTYDSVLFGLQGTEFEYSYFNGTLYFSDGLINKKITSTSVSSWGLPIPSAPVLSQITGTYGQGRYLCSCSFVDENGMESGGSKLAEIVLTKPSGIYFGNLPTLPPGSVSLRLYLSTVDGKELYHVADTTMSFYAITGSRYDDGNIAEMLSAYPPPPASIIRFYNGRAYVVDKEGGVWYSNPYSFDHFQLASSYLMLPLEVVIMEPVTNGIFFATAKETFFYAGNPESGFSVIKKYDYGAIKGTGKRIPSSNEVAWMSQRGVIIGSADGSCENRQEKNVATETGVSGATLIREQDGMRQVIACVKQPTTSKLAASGWITAEVVRRAT